MKTRTVHGPETIFLARHGESTWNAEGRIAGQLDPPLSASGLEQASSLARVLRGVRLRAVYASPLQRARNTALVTAQDHGLEVTTHPALREIHFGELQGCLRDERDPAARDLWLAWRRAGTGTSPAGGETRLQLESRIRDCLEGILNDGIGGQILIVGHRHANGAILGTLMGWTLERWTTLRIKHRYLYEISLTGKRGIATIRLGGQREGKRYGEFRPRSRAR